MIVMMAMICRDTPSETGNRNGCWEYPSRCRWSSPFIHVYINQFNLEIITVQKIKFFVSGIASRQFWKFIWWKSVQGVIIEYFEVFWNNWIGMCSSVFHQSVGHRHRRHMEALPQLPPNILCSPLASNWLNYSYWSVLHRPHRIRTNVMGHQILKSVWETAPEDEYFSIPLLTVPLRETIEAVHIDDIPLSHLSDGL